MDNIKFSPPRETKIKRRYIKSTNKCSVTNSSWVCLLCKVASCVFNQQKENKRFITSLRKFDLWIKNKHPNYQLSLSFLHNFSLNIYKDLRDYTRHCSYL